jgi:hypothetical protein
MDTHRGVPGGNKRDPLACPQAQIVRYRYACGRVMDTVGSGALHVATHIHDGEKCRQVGIA